MAQSAGLRPAGWLRWRARRADKPRLWVRSPVRAPLNASVRGTMVGVSLSTLGNPSSQKACVLEGFA